jgi:hypothetical protein
MISLETTLDAMVEMQYGDKQADLVFALRVAALSPLQDLEVNGNMTRLLAQFVGKPLPEKEVLYNLLHTAKTETAPALCFKNHMTALYSIDEAWLSGKLDRFMTIPESFDGQVAWRAGLNLLINGMGLKTIAFACLLMNPFKTFIVAIDRHHLRRLGEPTEKSISTKKYLALELSLKAEQYTAGFSQLSLGVFSAYLWGIQRSGNEAVSYPSHKNLSVHWY